MTDNNTPKASTLYEQSLPVQIAQQNVDPAPVQVAENNTADNSRLAELERAVIYFGKELVRVTAQAGKELQEIREHLKI